MTGPEKTTPPIPLDRWLHRRKWRRRFTLWIGLALAALLIVLRPASRAHELAGLDRARGEVVAVVDSRTLRIHPQGREKPIDVRLTGLGAWPDGRHGDLDAWHRELVGRTVELDTDTPWGAYVYRDDGLWVNEQLIDQGVAPHDVTARHPASAWFARLERYARVNKAGPRGRWAELAETQPD